MHSPHPSPFIPPLPGLRPSPRGTTPNLPPSRPSPESSYLPLADDPPAKSREMPGMYGYGAPPQPKLRRPSESGSQKPPMLAPMMTPYYGPVPLHSPPAPAAAGYAAPWASPQMPATSPFGAFPPPPPPGHAYIPPPGYGFPQTPYMPPHQTPYAAHYPLPGAFVPDVMVSPPATAPTKLARPKAAPSSDNPNKWLVGKDLGPVLDNLTLGILNVRVLINPLIQSTPESSSQPRIIYDLLFPPSTAHLSNEDPSKSWSTGRDAPATFPRVASLRIVSAAFPWMITVENPEGVTCSDVVEAIYKGLHPRVASREYNACDPAFQNKLSMSYHFNRSTDPSVPGGRLGEGMRRIDWLLDRTMFEGIDQDEEYVTERLGVGGKAKVRMGATFVLKTSLRAVTSSTHTSTSSTASSTPAPPTPGYIPPTTRVSPQTFAMPTPAAAQFRKLH